MTMLLGANLLRELTETVILSGKVINTSPISLLLIAPPESGKTSVVLDRPCKAAFPLCDVTGRGLMQLCKLSPEITHFIINDLVTVMAHKPTVNRYTLSIINAMTEEGIAAVAFPGTIETFAHGKRAIIACLTCTLAKDQRSWWNRSGLSSRMFPFCFDHSAALTIRIRQAINSDRHDKISEEFLLPEKAADVLIPKNLIEPISRIAEAKAQEFSEKGYRRLKQYRTLAKAHALWRSPKARLVTNADVNFLLTVSAYVSYTKVKPL